MEIAIQAETFYRQNLKDGRHYNSDRIKREIREYGELSQELAIRGEVRDFDPEEIELLEEFGYACSSLIDQPFGAGMEFEKQFEEELLGQIRTIKSESIAEYALCTQHAPRASCGGFQQSQIVVYTRESIEMELYISGGKHLWTDVEGRLEEIEDTIGEPDVIFVETRERAHSIKRRLLNWLCAPVLLASLTIWLVISRVGSLFFQSDDEITAELQQRYNLEPVSVDKPVHGILTSQIRDWAIANWTALILPIMSFYFLPGLLGIIIGLFALIAVAVPLMIAYLCGVNDERNLYMATKIVQISEDNEYECGSLITGGKHSKSLHNIAHHFSGIEVVSPHQPE